ncbi:hypothetical protein [Clostridium cylindrosporum]|uniref:Uncharacterized protein n=1 Tax=Clostridium cylindrosporum DSM 605 TaxID=1121307 RepID=A0A0J8D949_CLOCY|nr:hypothetical protein [Clostridium cylindrosporum]KMT20869.1 hypothetical protein CLCY_1c01030 [Clostridium cylindrosporum DSM 605]
MMRLWGKIIKNNKIIFQHESNYAYDDLEYQDQLKYCIEVICKELDIQKPYWLNSNLKEYNKYKKTSFTQDNFIEEIEFDKLEIEVLDE